MILIFVYIDFFKLLINGKSVNLTSIHLQNVISELCGQISTKDVEYITNKTWMIFGSKIDQGVTEEIFVNVTFAINSFFKLS